MTEKPSSNEERMVNELEEIAKALKTIRSELAKANACLTRIDGNLDLVNVDLPDQRFALIAPAGLLGSLPEEEPAAGHRGRFRGFVLGALHVGKDNWPGKAQASGQPSWPPASPTSAQGRKSQRLVQLATREGRLGWPPHTSQERSSPCEGFLRSRNPGFRETDECQGVSDRSRQWRRFGRTAMPRTCLQLVALIGSLAASMALLGCDDNGMRTVEAKTSVAEARVSTRLPPSEVSDDFLLATATVAAEAASVPHPVAAAVVAEPPVPAPPPGNAMPTAPDDTATNQMPSETNTQPDAATNAQ